MAMGFKRSSGTKTYNGGDCQDANPDMYPGDEWYGRIDPIVMVLMTGDGRRWF